MAEEFAQAMLNYQCTVNQMRSLQYKLLRELYDRNNNENNMQITANSLVAHVYINVILLSLCRCRNILPRYTFTANNPSDMKIALDLTSRGHSIQETSNPFDAHCCNMGTAIKHPVPDRVKPSFVIFDTRAL